MESDNEMQRPAVARFEILAKAEELGGKTVAAPRDVPEFRLTFAFFEDPEGHLVGLSRGVLKRKNDA
jgi:predicted enzyme related to lactoylglutathione lyase